MNRLIVWLWRIAGTDLRHWTFIGRTGRAVCAACKTDSESISERFVARKNFREQDTMNLFRFGFSKSSKLGESHVQMRSCV